MSVIYADRIVPRYGTSTSMQSLGCADAVADSDIVNLRTLEAYMTAPTTHAYESVAVSETLAGSNGGATMVGRIERVGDVVTLSWNDLTFTAWDLSLYRDVLSFGALDPRTLASGVVYYYNDENRVGRISLQSGGLFCINSDNGEGEFAAGYTTIYSGSLSWPFNNVA